jgi:hypothetical protein
MKKTEAIAALDLVLETIREKRLGAVKVAERDRLRIYRHFKWGCLFLPDLVPVFRQLAPETIDKRGYPDLKPSVRDALVEAGRVKKDVNSSVTAPGFTYLVVLECDDDRKEDSCG